MNLKKNSILLSLIFLFFSQISFAEIKVINNIEVKDLISKGVPLIDIRSPIEWKETGVIEGSHLITFFNDKGKVNLDNWYVKFNIVADKSKPFILICASGVRSKFASFILSNQFSFPKIYDASEGISGWLKQGQPVIKSY